MAPPHRCVALMAAVAAAALLLSLDAHLARATGLRSWGVKDGHMISRSPYSVRAVSFAMSEAERLNTLKVLQAFAAAMPSLGWSGHNFCRWSGVTCFDANVNLLITRLWVPGTLPEMPDDVDYSMVKLNEIHVFGEDSGVTGTLPSSWGKLRKVRTINLAYTGISGTLPAAWSSMASIEQIILFNTQITGTLPEAWSALPNLRRMYLQGCSLYGSLPESWARMPPLERLGLFDNHFCGCVPESWLTSPTLLMGVDARHRMANCSTAEACVVVATQEPLGISWSVPTIEPTTATTATTTTMPPASTRTTEPPPPSESQCNVPNCTSCAPDDGMRCNACASGYSVTDDWRCMKTPDTMEPNRFTTRKAERWNTLKVLQAFAAAMPSLGWSGDDFCRWSGVRCTDANASIIVSRSWVTGTLPEMPDDVDYSMVRLDQIHLFGQRSGITGTLPSSWSKLAEVRVINLGYTGIVGTLPAAWSSMSSLRSLRLGFTRVFGTLPAEWSAMRAVEEIVLSTTEISGTLPEAWSIMPSLRRLHLQRSNLYGSFPESWARMPSLERVSLHDNYFCGCVPESWVRSATLLVSVDAKHWAEDCATADACIEMATPDPVLSSSGIIRAAEATRSTTSTSNIPYSTTPSTRAETRRTTTRAPAVTSAAPAAPECKVLNCMTCATGDSTRCSRCLLGYLSTAGRECKISASADASVMPPGSTPTAAICVAVVVVSAMLAYSALSL